MVPRVVAVTGVAGFLGQRLLPLLDADARIERIVGLDVREPARRARKLEFHLVDISGADLVPYLRGVDAVVHLASVLGPRLDDEVFERVNLGGARRVIEASATAGVRKIVRPSSTSVYGAWENNPVPLTESAPLRPCPGYLPAIVDAECERLLADWRRASDGRVATRLRIAPVMGAGVQYLLAAAALGRPPVRVRTAAAPIQVVHAADAAAALALAAAVDLDGVYNVAADGWLSGDDAAALTARTVTPAVPYELAERFLALSWSSGWGDAPASVLPYLVHPWVVANDRMRGAGWSPSYSNADALLFASFPDERNVVPWIVGAGALTALTVVGVGTAVGVRWLVKRR
jgi:nucleoside-diphosphate-sugar epimerase